MTDHERPLRIPLSSTAIDFEDAGTLKTVGLEVTSSVDGVLRTQSSRRLSNHSSAQISTNEGPRRHGKQPEPISQATENQLGTYPELAHEDSSRPVGKAAQSETVYPSADQLMADAEEIHQNLQNAEIACFSFQRSQLASNEEQFQWQDCVLLHQGLLTLHEDIFLLYMNSHHPSADSLLEEFYVSRSLPARMSQYGIYSPLEVMRKHDSRPMEHMFSFISFAYSLMTWLSVTVPIFRDSWNEQLGDLARYRMAINPTDNSDHEVWTSVSTYWYNRVAHDCPSFGRIQHHLGILSRQDAFQRLFYHTKACTCVEPFTTQTLSTFLDPYKEENPLHQDSTVTSLLAIHSVLFFRGQNEQFITSANKFLRFLQRELNPPSAPRMRQVYIMSSNIASILQFGASETSIAMEFFHTHNQGRNAIKAYTEALECHALGSIDERNTSVTAATRTLSWTAFQGASLTFQTLAVLLYQMEDSSICPSIHISLAFIWCLALHPLAMQQIERIIPWLAIIKYLNFFRSREAMPKGTETSFENESFPLFSDITVKHLPEDFYIRGLLWSHLYYPKCFFEGAPLEHERPSIGVPYMAIVRANRCFWLGVRLSSFKRWMTYDPDRGFTETQFARQSAPLAASSGGLNSERRASTSDQRP